MNPLSLYTLKVILCSGMLLGYYWLALRNKIFHQWNRFYLLACVVLSLAAPLLKINFSPAYTAPPSNVLHILNVVSVSGAVEAESHAGSAFALSREQWLLVLYVLVSVIVFVIIAVSSIRIYRILRSYPKTRIDDIFFLNTDAKGTPFSFFNYIVWNHAIDVRSKTGQRIFQHELVHVQQRHTCDKVFLLLLLIPFWCNPFFWLIRKELTALHEFAADEKAVAPGDAAAFAQLILNTTFPEQNFLFTSHLFQSTIKRRIAMFTKLQHPKVNYWSRIAALPVLLIVIASFALKTKPVTAINFSPLDKPITVVIDAGHGGNENGAQFDAISEKNIALAIAKRIKAQNENANIKIVLTRDNDVKTDLQSRVQVASDDKADLFLSIHVNAADGALNQQLKMPENGIQVVVSSKNPPYQKQSELFGSMLVQKLESAYTTQAELYKPNTGVWVIDHNVCPAVLIECGYLTNKQDRDFITQEANQTLIANKILDAIAQYGLLKNMGGTSFTNDTFPSRMYDNKAVADVQYFEWPKKEVHIFFADGTKDTISYPEAKAANLFDTEAITRIENRTWETEKDTAPNYAAGDFTVRKATTEEAQNFKGIIVLNNKVFNGGFQELPIKANDIAKVFFIKKVSYGQELGIQMKSSDSLLSVSTKAFLKATTRLDSDPKNEPLFLQPEIEPKFPETDGGWIAFLEKNLNGAVPATHHAPSGTYKVVVGFIVDMDGKLYDLKPLTHYGYGMEDEVVRTLKLSPDWKPAQQNGRVVTSYRKQPVTFVVSKS